MRGAALLWQPEIIFPYLALLEKYTSTPDLMEAAVGAIQNLTACSWKVGEREREERGGREGEIDRKRDGKKVKMEESEKRL